MTLHIFTTGTSVAMTNKNAEGICPIDHITDETRFRKYVGLKVVKLKRNVPDKYLAELSAETNGLFRSGVQRGDKVVLLSSDTDEGELCADVLSGIIRDHFAGVSASWRRIKGLQVSDPTAFRREGIPNLFKTLDELTKEKSTDEVRLNVSGGFKGTVPFMVVYAMFSDLPVAYVFERTEGEILLPGFPIEFDWDRYSPAAEALLGVEAKTAMTESEILDLLPDDHTPARRAFRALFELFEDEKYTLSALGMLVVERLRTLTENTPINISPTAQANIAGFPTDDAKVVQKMISRLRNPLMRTLPGQADRLHTTDLRVMKSKTRTATPRVLYWISSGNIHVAEVFLSHDDYEHFWNNDPHQIDEYNTASFVEFQVDINEPVEAGFLEKLDSFRQGTDQKITDLEEQLRIHRRTENILRADLSAVKKARGQNEERVAERVRNAANEKWQQKMRKSEVEFQKKLESTEKENQSLKERMLELQCRVDTFQNSAEENAQD